MIDNIFDATIIGAGPSGIATMAAIIDDKERNKMEKFLWIDPKFSSGMFENYTNVPSNTKVKLFKKYFKSFNCFQCKLEVLDHYDQDSGCDLQVINELLKQVTQNLLKLVTLSSKEIVLKIEKNKTDSTWKIITNINNSYFSKRIFACIGSHPKQFDLNEKLSLSLLDNSPSKISFPSLIPFNIAIDRDLIGKYVNDQDIVVVYGSSHSAMLIMMNLVIYSNAQKIINVHTKPIIYAESNKNDKEGIIIHDNTGLKGSVAQWAKDNLENGEIAIDDEIDNRLSRTMDQNVINMATKVIIAMGFERNIIDGLSANYDPADGTILDEQGDRLDGIWGFGIAYPAIDDEGAPDVGLWKFIKQLRRNKLFKEN